MCTVFLNGYTPESNNEQCNLPDYYQLTLLDTKSIMLCIFSGSSFLLDSVEFIALY